ncbi:phospholipase D family protein [Alcanivorax sp. S6407]|uniref:phospholipase D family protein n=1 Tax=Alcanivorax sp. S6407 TaxID=2926424 RepID=UPI001FF4B24C|nr:phospholipase D family protein [Alcanivorax sp. S6407]MCK0154725.1 phospholipase D family protein [Alcanivorax sp. S6407]
MTILPKHFSTLLLMTLLSTGCQSAPPYDPEQRTSSNTLVAVQSPLVKGLQAKQSQHEGQSGFYLLHDGLSAFLARMALIENATTSLDLQYYIFTNDVTGRIIISRLLHAADRGVRVRVLVDDMGTQIQNPLVARLDQHPNIEIRIFNPVASRNGASRNWQILKEFTRTNHRMHNKLMVADGVAIITGGRNLGDVYFSSTNVDFQDIDILAAGPIVPLASGSFDEYWGYPASVPVQLLLDPDEADLDLDSLRTTLAEFLATQQDSEFIHALRDSTLGKDLVGGDIPLHWGPASLLVDTPKKALEHADLPASFYLGADLKTILESSQEQLKISSAYFVPGDNGVALFDQLEDRGVEVKILTNSLSTTDVAIVHSGYMDYRKDLLNDGVELWELRSTAGQQKRMHWFKGKSLASLHAKTMVIDDHLSVVGSVNLDARSILQNTEIAVVIDSPAINQQLSDLFDRWVAGDSAWSVQLNEDDDLIWTADTPQGQLKEHHDPETSSWSRFKIWLLSWLPIDSQI